VNTFPDLEQRFNQSVNFPCEWLMMMRCVMDGSWNKYHAVLCLKAPDLVILVISIFDKISFSRFYKFIFYVIVISDRRLFPPLRSFDITLLVLMYTELYSYSTADTRVPSYVYQIVKSRWSLSRPAANFIIRS